MNETVELDDVLRDIRWVQSEIKAGRGSAWKLHTVIESIVRRCDGHPDAKVRALSQKLLAAAGRKP